jgi:hypothetical protein
MIALMNIKYLQWMTPNCKQYSRMFPSVVGMTKGNSENTQVWYNKMNNKLFILAGGPGE